MKSYKILIALVALFMISCTDEIDFQESLNAEESEVKSMSSGYMGVQSIFIDNGISQNCSRNMLVFSDDEHYINVMETLETMVEDHDDIFLGQYDYLNDDDLEQVEEQLGHSELQPLIEFENQLNFCSLRAMLHNLEEIWLNQQPNGSQLINSPEETYLDIDDEFESALLNEQAEVIIGRNLYKYYEGGYIIIDFTNITDLTGALTDLNSGANPNDVAMDYRPFIEVIEQPLSTSPLQGDCIERYRGYKIIQFNDGRQGKTSIRWRETIVQHRLRNKLRGYKWSNSSNRYKRRRMRLASGFEEGTTLSTINENCFGISEVPHNWKRSKKRRKSRTWANNVPKIFNSPFPWQYETSLHNLASWNWVQGNEFVVPISDLD